MKQNSDKWAGKAVYQRLSPSGSKVAEMKPVWITDLSVCTPQEALSDRQDGHHWDLIPYVAGGMEGKLLHAGRSDPSPELRLKPGVAGWHAIYVWCMGGDVDLEAQYPADFDSVYSMSNGPALRFSGDKRWSSCFRTMSHDKMLWPGLECMFWCYADLTDQDIHIRHQGSTVYLGAFELIPLADEEVRRAIPPDGTTPRRLVVKEDSPTVKSTDRIASALKNRNIKAWVVGNEDEADLYAADSPNLRYSQTAAREVGAEFYICDRPSLWSRHRHHDDRRSLFMEEHPDTVVRTRDGTPSHQLSYACDEVVEHMLERLRESAKSAPDGYGYFFNRDPGMVGFEPAALNGFEEAHGVDPLTLPDRDERLLSWQADIITRFLQRSREALDQVAAEINCPRIKQVSVVLGDEAANASYGFDVARWVKEGLMDVIFPYPWADYPDRWLAQGFADMDVEYFTGLVAGTSCECIPMWLSGQWRTHWTPEHVRPNEYLTRARADYAAGADGLATWDTIALNNPPSYILDRWLRLGDPAALDGWIADDFPLPSKVRFTRYAGATLDPYPPGTGG